jgi:hypothetical protein
VPFSCRRQDGICWSSRSPDRSLPHSSSRLSDDRHDAIDSVHVVPVWNITLSSWSDPNAGVEHLAAPTGEGASPGSEWITLPPSFRIQIQGRRDDRRMEQEAAQLDPVGRIGHTSICSRCRGDWRECQSHPWWRRVRAPSLRGDLVAKKEDCVVVLQGPGLEDRVKLKQPQSSNRGDPEPFNRRCGP